MIAMIEIKMSKKERLEAWLDAQIEFKERGGKYSGKIYNLAILGDRSIHVTDAKYIARMLGYDIHTAEHSDEYRKRYFMYKGYEVFNLYENKRRKKDAEIQKTEITD